MPPLPFRERSRCSDRRRANRLSQRSRPRGPTPSTLGGVMAIIPPLNGSTPYGAPSAALPSAPVAAAKTLVPVRAHLPRLSMRSSRSTMRARPRGASFAQPSGDPQDSYASDNRLEQLAAPGLGGANPRESYYFLDEGLSASTRASPLPYGWNGQSLDLGVLPSQHRPELALPPISGARQFDAHFFRRDFPILNEYVNGKPLIWLDNAATTQKPQAVIDRLSHFYARENSNVHRAAHALAARSTDAFEAAREKVRRFINAPSDDTIVWVRGTTEAINLVAQGLGRAQRAGRRRGRRHPSRASLQHRAVADALRREGRQAPRRSGRRSRRRVCSTNMRSCSTRRRASSPSLRSPMRSARSRQRAR